MDAPERDVERLRHGARHKPAARRRKALTALATLVGALSMARAVNDKNLSWEILKSVADELKSGLG